MAAAAILNAIWDLYAKQHNKPVWKLLADMTPEEIVKCIDFTYITDALTPQQAIDILAANQATKQQRIEEIRKSGFPAYTTSAGWLNYTDDQIQDLLKGAMAQGFERFKMKVGASLEDDMRRAKIIRSIIGYDRMLAMDANQVWTVDQAIANMKELAQFKPKWIEEPTSPDDILGHAKIAKELRAVGVKVATGEHCQNRVIFKQLFQAQAFDFCQIDSCRVGSINENLAIILMAKKFGLPVIPHAGGVGLCEYVQHLVVFDFVSVSAEMSMCEFANHLHEHFVHPVVVKAGNYQVPEAPGYSVDMKADSLVEYEYPNGKVWQDLIARGVAETKLVKE